MPARARRVFLDGEPARVHIARGGRGGAIHAATRTEQRFEHPRWPGLPDQVQGVLYLLEARSGERRTAKVPR